MTTNSKCHVKWPNDILIDEKKVCGVLMELENDRLVVGIGCNVGSSPSVDATGVQGGRPSTSLAEYNPSIKSYKNDSNELVTPPHHQIAEDMFQSIKYWILSEETDTVNSVVNDFEKLMTKSPQKLRDDVTSLEKKQNIRLVYPLNINQDGTLSVRYDNSDEIVTLVAEYLW